MTSQIMNQFVDLTEDGSFEVRFGKVLSSPLPPPPSTSPAAAAAPSAKSEKQTQTGGAERKESLFQTTDAAPNQYQNADQGSRAQALSLVAQAVQRVGPAVVRVETETYLDAGEGGADASEGPRNDRGRGNKPRNEKGEGDGGGSADPSADGEDRGDVFDGVPEAPAPRVRAPDDPSGREVDFGQGSGMIVNSEGYVLTNAHVVEGAARVHVVLTDGRRLRAEVRGSDDIVDVAVLRIVPDDEARQPTAPLPVARLGDSDRMEVGQFVTAIGSPGGLDNTCTIGIVSGLKRCPKVVGIPDKLGALDYIQTDAAINQGEGALVARACLCVGSCVLPKERTIWGAFG